MSAVPALHSEEISGGVRGCLPALVPGRPLRVVRVRSPLHTSTVELLTRADDALMRACCAESAGKRYVLAHLAALRSATAVLSERATKRGGRQSVWTLLAKVAPDLGEWALFFEETGRMRTALETGTAQVSVRQADDLVREAERFSREVFRVLDILVVVDP